MTTKGIEKGRAGPLFEDFLREQGTYEETTEVAIKRVLAFQLAAAMKEQAISKVEMAKRLRTSRSQLDRLLDPENDTVTLAALARAARAVGRSLSVELV
ncbi:MAG: helix-turn-helix domain-containing protein [Bauldia litoralis]